jgi:hypothetical protein
MTSFLYYVPGHQKDMISPEEIAKAGLGYVFDNPHTATCNSLRSSGPDGKAGAIITDHSRIEPGRNQYKPDAQTWAINHDHGFWVGIWNEAMPGPDDLQRKKLVPGQTIELGDRGQVWLVPMAQRFSEPTDPDRWFDVQCTLPSRLEFGPGRTVLLGRPFEKYSVIWAICQADRRLRSGSGTEADERLVVGINRIFAAIAVLQANYAIGATEVELLGLFDQDAHENILNIFGDWLTWLMLVDKHVSAQETPVAAVAEAQ